MAHNISPHNHNPLQGKIHSGMGEKTLCAYFLGLLLSLILTLAAFSLVYYKESWHKNQLVCLLASLAIVQFLVQIHFFLRLHFKQSGTLNAIPFLFALVIICILVAGSLWIMYHLNYNMAMR